MKDQFNLSDKIITVGDPVKESDIDTYAQVAAVERQNQRHSIVLGAWEKQHDQERKLRERYAWYFLLLMFFQIICVNTAFFLIGCGVLTVEPWTAKTFMLAVFAELSAMTFWIVKYLFPSSAKSILELI